MKNFILVLLVAVMVFSCSMSKKDSFNAVLELQSILLESDFISEPLQNTVVTEHFTDEQLKSLISAIDYYVSFKERWNEASDLTTDQKITMFISEYKVLRSYYKEIYTVVRLNWDKYSEDKQTYLMGVHRKAERVDHVVEKAIAIRQFSAAAGMAFDVGKLFVEVAKS